MTDVPPRLREIAEDLNANLPLGEGRQRIVDDRFVIWIGTRDHPAFTVVQRLRLQGHDVAATVAEVRELLATRFDRHRASWEVGSSAEPADLEEQLVALGMAPDPEEPLATGMVLVGGAPEPPAGVEARICETVDDYLQAQAIMNRAFGMPEEDAATARAAAERQHAQDLRTETTRTFMAFVDGEPAAAAAATFLPEVVVMNGGATVEHLRGRGAYRALVAARFAEGVRRGTPALLTQAGAMSRPILARLGFEPVARVRILIDEGGG